MKSAVELLDVIESSHLPVTEKWVDDRSHILKLVEICLKQPDDGDCFIAEQVAALLLKEGVLLGDQESIEEVVVEYLQVVSNEAEGLGEDEKNFLDNFLK